MSEQPTDEEGYEEYTPYEPPILPDPRIMGAQSKQKLTDVRVDNLQEALEVHVPLFENFCGHIPHLRTLESRIRQDRERIAGEIYRELKDNTSELYRDVYAQFGGKVTDKVIGIVTEQDEDWKRAQEALLKVREMIAYGEFMQALFIRRERVMEELSRLVASQYSQPNMARDTPPRRSPPPERRESYVDSDGGSEDKSGNRSGRSWKRSR